MAHERRSRNNRLRLDCECPTTTTTTVLLMALGCCRCHCTAWWWHCRYRQDVLSRSLSWSNPCHTDAAFWQNNAKHFEAHSCLVLRALVSLLGEQLGGPASIGDLYSEELLAVACHDVGQIVMAHPRGHALLGADAKRYCLAAAQSRSSEVVRKAGLLATQRIMVASLG
eukprot:COSAG01_NODE_805_length_13443_cov_81.464928_16_plen_169_part_00